MKRPVAVNRVALRRFFLTEAAALPKNPDSFDWEPHEVVHGPALRRPKLAGERTPPTLAAGRIADNG